MLTKKKLNKASKKITTEATNVELLNDKSSLDAEVQKITVTLSSDINLYFHTEAAEQISLQLQHDQGDRIRLAKKILKAIQNGEIDAYDYRDGKLMPLPIGLQPSFR